MSDLLASFGHWRVRHVGAFIAPRHLRLKWFLTNTNVIFKSSRGLLIHFFLSRPRISCFRNSDFRLRAVELKAKSRMSSHPKSGRSEVRLTEIYRPKAPDRAVNSTYRDHLYDPNSSNVRIVPSIRPIAIIRTIRTRPTSIEIQSDLPRDIEPRGSKKGIRGLHLNSFFCSTTASSFEAISY